MLPGLGFELGLELWRGCFFLRRLYGQIDRSRYLDRALEPSVALALRLLDVAEEVEAALALRLRLRLRLCLVLLDSFVAGAEPAPVLPGLGFELGLELWRGSGFGRGFYLRGGRCLCEPVALPARASRMPFAALFERELRLGHARLLGRWLGFLRLRRPNGAATEQAPASRRFDLRFGRARFLLDRFAGQDEWLGCFCRGILTGGRGRGYLDRALQRRAGFDLARLDLRSVRLGLALDRGQRPARLGLVRPLDLRLRLDLRDHLDGLALPDTPDERLDVLERRLRVPGGFQGERVRLSGWRGREKRRPGRVAVARDRQLDGGNNQKGDYLRACDQERPQSGLRRDCGDQDQEEGLEGQPQPGTRGGRRMQQRAHCVGVDPARDRAALEVNARRAVRRLLRRSRLVTRRWRRDLLRALQRVQDLF